MLLDSLKQNQSVSRISLIVNMRSLYFGKILCSLMVAVVLAKECDKTTCPGPIRFFEELNCKPIYEKPGDCCAVRYDCSNLKNRSPDKCYANGHEYAIGETLNDEDRINPCDLGCYCGKTNKNVSRFACAIVDCFPKEAKPGCYLRRKLTSCCQAEEICPENPEDRYKCEVDGKTYFDGDRFFPSNDPNSLCQCMEGYEGKNVPPFCRKFSCGVERRVSEIRQNCAPIFEYHQSPAKACSSNFRCQNENDTIISSAHEQNPNEPDHNMCKYGSLKLHIGDELNESTHYAAKCVKCVCEVPPTLTCKRLTQEECNVKYPIRS